VTVATTLNGVPLGVGLLPQVTSGPDAGRFFTFVSVDPATPFLAHSRLTNNGNPGIDTIQVCVFFATAPAPPNPFVQICDTATKNWGIGVNAPTPIATAQCSGGGATQTFS